MKDPRDIIIKPLISEKSYKLIEQNKYSFIVHPKAKKPEIRWAVEEIFGVTVTGVNTITKRPKKKRQGWTSGWTSGSKRAVVTLKEGDRIELFEAR